MLAGTSAYDPYLPKSQQAVNRRIADATLGKADRQLPGTRSGRPGRPEWGAFLSGRFRPHFRHSCGRRRFLEADLARGSQIGDIGLPANTSVLMHCKLVGDDLPFAPADMFLKVTNTNFDAAPVLISLRPHGDNYLSMSHADLQRSGTIGVVTVSAQTSRNSA